MVRVAWDVSHQEFTIEDHYYFGKLKSALDKRGIAVKEINHLDYLEEYDVLVINYPEIKFSRSEIRAINKFIHGGGRVIILGYYRNEDGVADAVNSLSGRYGLELNADYIFDRVNNYGGDELFIVTTKVNHFNHGVNRVMMPCTASIRILKKNAYVIVAGEDSAKASSLNRPIIGAGCSIGKGELIVIGTCVFWDNYAIDKYDNYKFAMNLLAYTRRK